MTSKRRTKKLEPGQFLARGSSMPDKLEPPPEHQHHRWHWIETEHGPMCASWFPEISGIRSAWDISGHNKFSDDPLVLRMWRYIGPAIPPHEERQDPKDADEA